MSSLIQNINDFGVKLISKNNGLSNIINYQGNMFQINIKSLNITFLELSKYFPEYIITDIANKFSIQLINQSKQIISANWINPLDKNKIIIYMITLYNNELQKNIQYNPITNSKTKKQTKGKYKKKSIPLTLKRKVWDYWIGESVGKTKCPCCKLSDITQMNFSCGHIVPESQGGALTVQNLKPICSSCNSSMGTQHMQEFIAKYGL
jgi:hypothetical protein